MHPCALCSYPTRALFCDACDRHVGRAMIALFLAALLLSYVLRGECDPHEEVCMQPTLTTENTP